MRGSTHMAAGAVAGIALATMTNTPPEQALSAIGAAALGSILPDIDSATSKLGRRILPVSFLIHILFGHRQMFHAPLFWTVVAGITLWYAPAYALPITFGYLGCLLHLFLDSLNPAGIPWLWPYSRRFHIWKFQTGGLVDRLLGISLTVVAAIYLTTNFAEQATNILHRMGF